MSIIFRINTASFQEAQKLVKEISDFRAELIKNYPDIVVNVEVAMK